MTRQQIGFETKKLYKVQVRKKLRKVVGRVVDRSHNIVERNNGYTYTPTSTSPSKDQHFDGLHVTEANIVEMVGQPIVHTNLETLGLK
jgi:hypothetical protein